LISRAETQIFDSDAKRHVKRRITSKPEVMPPGWQIAPGKRARINWSGQPHQNRSGVCCLVAKRWVFKLRIRGNS
jgi:hypothetical protein